jgi:beta-galactosidase
VLSAVLWRAAGLHRLQHRVVDVAAGEDALLVRTRVAPPAQRFGMDTTYRWTSDGDRLALDVEVQPTGDWPETVPRLGVRLALPGSLTRVEWVGRGPGEAYADSLEGTRLGRWAADVGELQTPYVRPQENGQRLDVRQARLLADDGTGLTVAVGSTDGSADGSAFALTVRPWSTAALEAARHTPDLVPDGRVWVHLDHAQHGLGSHSCGPDVLEPYRLHPRPARFGFVLGTC